MIDVHDLIYLQQKIGKAIDNEEVVDRRELNDWWRSLNVMITILIKKEE